MAMTKLEWQRAHTAQGLCQYCSHKAVRHPDGTVAARCKRCLIIDRMRRRKVINYQGTNAGRKAIA